MGGSSPKGSPIFLRSSPPIIMTRPLSLTVSILLLLGLVAWSYSLATDSASRVLSFSLLAGAAFGIVLQRGRFCFLCNLRDFVDRRDASGLISILVALAGGILVYLVVLGAWVPVPQADRLPPGAHIGPVGFVLALAAFAFGLGMALSGSCLSAHFYRLGEGAFGSIVALAGAALGFLIGFLTWNALYIATVFDDQPLWLPVFFGYTGAAFLSLSILAALAFALLYASRPSAPKPHTASTFDAVFVDRWPPVVTGLLVAVISGSAYLRVAPLVSQPNLVASCVRQASPPASCRKLLSDSIRPEAASVPSRQPCSRQTGYSSSGLSSEASHLLWSQAVSPPHGLIPVACSPGLWGHSDGMGCDDRPGLHGRRPALWHPCRRLVRLGIPVIRHRRCTIRPCCLEAFWVSDTVPTRRARSIIMLTPQNARSRSLEVASYKSPCNQAPATNHLKINPNRKKHAQKLRSPSRKQIWAL